MAAVRMAVPVAVSAAGLAPVVVLVAVVMMRMAPMIMGLMVMMLMVVVIVTAAVVGVRHGPMSHHGPAGSIRQGPPELDVSR